MAFRRSNVGSAITALPHESGAASRSPSPLFSLLPQAPRMRKTDGYALLNGIGCLVAQFGKLRHYYTTCWLWVVLLVFLTSVSGVYSAKDITARNCRYDLISIAAFSCLLPNGEQRAPSPSLTCCKALRYAVDYDPASSQSGACCLCRYMREKKSRPQLATSYVLCKGKDSHAVKKWSSFPMKICSTECRKTRNYSPIMGISTREDHSLEQSHGTGKAIYIFPILWAIVVICVLMGLTFFWYLRWFKQASNASEQGRRLSPNGGPQADRRHWPGRSSTKRKGRKF